MARKSRGEPKKPHCQLLHVVAPTHPGRMPPRPADLGGLTLESQLATTFHSLAALPHQPADRPPLTHPRPAAARSSPRLPSRP